MIRLIVLVICIFCFLKPTKAMSRYDMIEYKQLKREESQILRRMQKLGSMMENCDTKYKVTKSLNHKCHIRQNKIDARYNSFDIMLEEVKMELEEFEE